MLSRPLFLALLFLGQEVVVGYTSDYGDLNERRLWSFASGWSSLLYSVGICHHKGPLCPKPPSSHSSSSGTDTDTEETNLDEVYGTEEWVEGRGDGGSSDVSTMNVLSLAGILIAAAAVAAFIVGMVYRKKQKEQEEALQNKDKSLHSAVAKRMGLLESGAVAPGSDAAAAARPPAFIELSNTSGGSPVITDAGLGDGFDGSIEVEGPTSPLSSYSAMS